MSEVNLQELFGGIDIYLFDQLLKGRFDPGMRILDAGCGSGRNLVYFLRKGYEVFGVDQSAAAISQTQRLAAALAPHLRAENFRVEPVEKMSWESAPVTTHIHTSHGFEFVTSSALIYFAPAGAH